MKNSKTILIVDDDERNIVALNAVLKIKGYSIITALSAEEGFAKLKAFPAIDLILMDIMMPEMDGYDAIKWIRSDSNRKDIPIIAITAKTLESDMMKCLEVGANDYCQKPIQINMLIDKIESFTNKEL